MKIGAIILCRYSSSRLPGKILKEIEGKPLIQYIIERLRLVKDIDEIIVTTSTEESDNPIVNYCTNNNITFFRGDLENVSKRFLDCATSHNLDYAIRINGDNLFSDPRIISEMCALARSKDYDFLTNVKDRSFPKGISVEIIKTAFYAKAIEKFETDYHKEHVTIYFYEHTIGDYYYYKNTTCTEAAGVQLAIDTIDDFMIAEKIIRKLGKLNITTGFEDIFKAYSELTSD